MKKVWKIMSSRIFQWITLILLQLILMFALFYVMSVSSEVVDLLLRTLSIVMVLYIINVHDDPSFKLVWCIVILILPPFGGVFYLIFGGRKVPKELRSSPDLARSAALDFLQSETEILEELQKKDPRVAQQFDYLISHVYYPAYKNTEVTYFKSGEEKFAHLMRELNRAKKTIYLEYFIIAPGKMWGAIYNVLRQKVKEGVDVRLIYDDAGCINTLPKDFDTALRNEGIKCEVFNPLRPQLVIQMNNRDHRKLVIIDNQVAFTGGVNLADEYINEVNRFGHWKDTAIMMKGEAAMNCTFMFMQIWNFLSEDKIEEIALHQKQSKNIQGYVLPFSDTPTDVENVGLNVHMNMINNAQYRIWIQTPYLIISYAMQQALCSAAKLGKDVRIIVPHVPDKWYAHMMTRGNYKELIQSGVKIYEYLPGFMHSKVFLCDHNMGLCGTINMDYRSYYMHYEDAVLMYECDALTRIEEDFLDTLEVSQLMTLEDVENFHWSKQLIYAVCNLFSPLM